jgi:hypothetical protein
MDANERECFVITFTRDNNYYNALVFLCVHLRIDKLLTFLLI